MANRVIKFGATGNFEKFNNRDEIKAYVEGKGHKLMGKTIDGADFLINNDLTSNSSKNKYAHDNNIPIITENDLLHMLGE
ncbi:MAG: hypothetical protein ACOCUE_04300 [Candidatus Izemoplasmataceae bacterium]